MTPKSKKQNSSYPLQFSEEIVKATNEPLTACYQCSRCAAGCPVAEETGFQTPDKLIRLIMLGDREAALKNDLVWRCVSCYTCGTRCPNNIHTSTINDALKQLSIKEGVNPTLPETYYFHQSFIRTGLKWGRVNEILFLIRYEIKNMMHHLKNKNWDEIKREFSNKYNFGLSMMKLKRMHYRLTKSKGRKELKRLASKSKSTIV